MKFLACSFLLFATSAFAGVSVSSPANNTKVSAPVHFVATATTGCSSGVSSMGIYTAPYVLAYKVSGSSLNTYLSLAPGTYNTVVQEWDNCGSSRTAITITVSGTSSTSTSTSTSTTVPASSHVFIV